MIETRYRSISPRFTLEPSGLFQEISALEPIALQNKIPIPWEKAVDFQVFDDQGNRWIDLTSGIFVTNAGHANPEVKRAIRDFLDADMLFSYTYPTKIKRDFLRQLIDLSPPHFDRVILLNSGSEACDDAYKLIKLWGHAHGRKHLLTFNGSYHGRVLSNEIVSRGKQNAAWSRVQDDEVIFLDFPYDEGTRFPIERLPPPGEVAGIFLETFQGWGAWMYPPAYIEDLARYARTGGVLVCFDEMQSGFYRLGPLYGYQTYGPQLQPDILCLGKGISSSLPIAAVLSRREIVDIDPRADLHSTHTGNPLCCAAALANLNFLSRPEFLSELSRKIEIFESTLRAFTRFPIVTRVNARGLIAGLIFEKEQTATAIVRQCVLRGVLPVCTNRNSIKLAPPLTIATEALVEALEVLAVCVAEHEPGK